MANAIKKCSKTNKYKSTYKKISKATREDLIDKMNKSFLTDSWLSYDDFSTKKLQEIFMRMYEESTSYKCKSDYSGYVTTNSPYGSNFPKLLSLDTAALLTCKSGKDGGVKYKFLDLGSGWGAMSWKAAIAGCEVHSVDISFPDKEFENSFSTNLQSILPKEIYNNDVIKVSSSFENLLTLHPEYTNSFDIVYSARVLHFQSPKNFNNYASTIYDLLKVNGYAYIVTDSIYAVTENKSCKAAYNHNKAHNYKAPGYLYAEYASTVSRDAIDLEKLICYIKDERLIENLDRMPLRDEEELKNGKFLQKQYFATFDLETLEEIFSKVGFNPLYSYYMGHASNGLIAEIQDNGAVSATIMLQKSAPIVDKDQVIGEVELFDIS